MLIKLSKEVKAAFAGAVLLTAAGCSTTGQTVVLTPDQSAKVLIGTALAAGGLGLVIGTMADAGNNGSNDQYNDNNGYNGGYTPHRGRHTHSRSCPIAGYNNGFPIHRCN